MHDTGSWVKEKQCFLGSAKVLWCSVSCRKINAEMAKNVHGKLSSGVLGKTKKLKAFIISIVAGSAAVVCLGSI